MTNPLTWEEENALTSIIEASIIARYDGETERRESYDRKGVSDGHYYVPLDTDAIRELLTQLWGDSLTTEVIESTIANLSTEGAAEWPHGYCEEDEEEEELERVLPGEYQGVLPMEVLQELVGVL